MLIKKIILKSQFRQKSRFRLYPRNEIHTHYGRGVGEVKVTNFLQNVVVVAPIDGVTLSHAVSNADTIFPLQKRRYVDGYICLQNKVTTDGVTRSHAVNKSNSYATIRAYAIRPYDRRQRRCRKTCRNNIHTNRFDKLFGRFIFYFNHLRTSFPINNGACPIVKTIKHKKHDLYLSTNRAYILNKNCFL